jgi:hypothetical protein
MIGRQQVGKPFSLSISGNNALSLNGSSQYGIVNNYAALNTLTDFTFEYWIYNQGVNAGKPIHELAPSTAEFFRDGFDGGGTNSSNDGVGYSGNESFFGTTQASARCRASNTWEHNCWVFNATNKTLAFYVNGVAVSSDFSQIGSGTQNTSNAANIYLGTNRGVTNFANVRLACLRVWNYQRQRADILANKNVYLDPTQETGLIANLNMIEGSGTTIANTVAGANGATLTGTPSWAAGPAVVAKAYNGPRSTAGARTSAGGARIVAS